MDGFVTIRLPAFARPDREVPASGGCTVVAPGDSASDEELMSQLATGSREALALLFRRYAGIVRRVAYRVLRDPSEADDLLQDIFLLIYRKADTYDPSRSPARFWILRMTYHRAISRRRHLDSRHFYTRLDLEAAADELAAPRTQAQNYEASVEGVLGSGALTHLFGGLSENQRRTLHLFFLEGYTLDEIACELGQSRENVKHHYFRGLEKLRKQVFGTHLRAE